MMTNDAGSVVTSTLPNGQLVSLGNFLFEALLRSAVDNSFVNQVVVILCMTDERLRLLLVSEH